MPLEDSPATFQWLWTWIVSPSLRVGLLVVLLAFAFQGTQGLWEPDEGRYTAVASEMLRTGDWIHPQLNDWTPHDTKPPLTYWLLSSSFAILGRNEWAARLPGAAAFAGTALLMWPLARRLLGDSADAARRVLYAPLLYATTAGPFVASNVVSTDGILTFFETVALTGFVAHEFKPSHRGPKALGLMWFGFALAFQTKGPPGLLPLLAILVFVLRVHGWRSVMRLFWLPGLALFAVLGLGWFAVICWQQPNMLGYFVGYEFIDRIATGTHGRHAAWSYALTIYVPALLGGSLPWVPVALVRVLWRRRVHGPRAWSPASKFLLLWITIPLAVFLVSKSRMYLYVLPLMVPLVLVAVLHWPHAALSLRRERWFATGWVVVLLSFRLGLGLLNDTKDSSRLAEALPPLPSDVGAVLVIDDKWRYGLAVPLRRQIRLVSPDLSSSEEPTLDEALSDCRKSQIRAAVLIGRRGELPAARSVADDAITPYADIDGWKVYLTDSLTK